MPIWRHLTSSPRLNGLSQNRWIRQIQVTPEGTPALLDLRSTETQERSKFCKLQLLHCEARVAKLADARDLKSRDSKESYRFDSDPGHHPTHSVAASLEGAKVQVQSQDFPILMQF